MTQSELNAAIQRCPSKTTDAMRRALTYRLVQGSTWREASIASGVTESGMLRAMRRLGLR